MTIARLPIRLVRSTALAAVFLKELVVSSVAVARAVLGRELNSASAIIAVPIGLQTDMGIAVLANCVTLTPGTTALHVSDDRRTLYIHVLDAPAPDDVISDIKTKFERRIREIEQ